MALNTNLEKIIPVACEGYKLVSSTATLTYTNAGGNSGVAKQVRSTAAETSTLIVPLTMGYNDYQFGRYIETVNIPVLIATANLSSAATVALYQTLISTPTVSTPANITASTITCSVNAISATNAADQLVTLTVTTPAFDSLSDQSIISASVYKAEFAFPCASSTVLTFFDGWITYREME